MFEHQESVLNAGVLLSIPALISQGLDKAFKVFKPLPPGFYGLHHIIIILCFMALCRIKNPEQLKKHSPGEFGKLIGLDRIPEVNYFRTKLAQTAAAVRQRQTNFTSSCFSHGQTSCQRCSFTLMAISGFITARKPICQSVSYRAKNFA